MLDLVIVAKAYPKINISLYVDKKKGDKHLIHSRFYLCLGDLYDEIAVFTTESINLDFYQGSYQYRDNFYLLGHFDCDIDNNLIYKAFKILHIQDNRNIIICVKKNIHTGAGLGGGSSNAAISLLIFNEIFALGYSMDSLLSMGEKLGSDVNFFIKVYTQNSNSLHPYFATFVNMSGHNIAYMLSDTHLHAYKSSAKLEFLSANVSGFGEIVQPFYEGFSNFRVHTNDIFSSTVAVYGEFDRLGCIGTRLDLSLDSQTLIQSYPIQVLNDLYFPASKLYPQLDIQRLHLEKSYNNVCFSGSGSSFFSL